MKAIPQILHIIDKYDIEIVSFGLAPCPDGFCYEQENVHNTVLRELDALLHSLNRNEQRQLLHLLNF